MNSGCERVGTDTNGRDVYLLFVANLEDMATIEPPGTPFVMFLGGDSATIPTETVFSVAASLLDRGAVYVLTWGQGADRFEDIVDEAVVARDLDGRNPTVMTTSHSRDSLEEALEFAITLALPAESFALSCHVVVVAFFGNVNWYNQAHNYLEDALHGPAA